MRAYEIHEFGIDKLRLVDRKVPEPGPFDALVKIHAASVNFRDLMIVNGSYNPRMKLPAVPFSDAAGEVIEIGSEVSRWRVGDHICTTVIPGWVGGEPTAEKSKTAIGAGNHDGVLQEFGSFHEDALVRAPKHLTMAEASTLPCAGLTAWHALVVSGEVQAGDRVLSLGTGGVSIFALQFAKMFGAKTIVTSSSDDKLDRARALGADHLINYRTRVDWEAAVLELTEGRGVDHVIEVGGTGTLPRSVKAVRVGGHIALIGALDTSGEFNPIPIFMRNIRVQGIFVGSREMFEDMNAEIERRQMKPIIDRVFTFEEARQALDHVQRGSHFGKVVIEM